MIFRHKKNFVIKTTCILLLFVMLLSYENTRASALNGLNLWLYNVIPVLFPYLFIINIIMHFNAFTILSFILYPIFHPIFKISKNACFCIISGFFCGFPVGIKTVNDMTRKKQILPKEANYLASFCNNLSLSFYLNFIIHDNIQKNPGIYGTKNYKLLLFILIILPYLSAIICSFIYRRINNYRSDDIIKLCKQNKDLINPSKDNSTNSFLDNCISNTLEALFKIGGYIIIFSILSGIITHYIKLPPPVKPAATTILEVSNGAVAFTGCSLKIIVTVLIPLCSFGGISAMFQSLQMITEKEVIKKNYIKYKFINTLITYLLATLICIIFAI